MRVCAGGHLNLGQCQARAPLQPQRAGADEGPKRIIQHFGASGPIYVPNMRGKTNISAALA